MFEGDQKLKDSMWRGGNNRALELMEFLNFFVLTSKNPTLFPPSRILLVIFEYVIFAHVRQRAR